MVVPVGRFRGNAPGGVGDRGEDRGPVRRRAEDHPAPTRRTLHPRKELPGPLLFVVVAAAYLALAQFVMVLNDPVKLGAGFWPAAGVTLGVLLLLPTRRWGWVVAAVGLAELGGDLAQGYPAGASLWWTAANCIEPLVGATMIRRYGNARGALAPMRNLLVFLAFGVVLGPLVGGTIGSIGTVTGFGSPIWQVWPKFVVGDGLGVLVVAPVLLTWHAPTPRRSLAERAAFATALVVLTMMAFRNWSGSWDVTLPYFIVPLLTWGALRLGVRGTARAVFVVTQIANWATANGYGPFAIAGGPDGHAITLLQGFLAITAASAFILAVLVSELSTRDDVERRLTAQAEHDTLTGLPNRAWIGKYLDAILDDARRAGRRVVLFVCDLDRFKVVNDSLGHQIGDQLIVQIGERMRHSVRPGDVVARLGGDEFVVVLDDPADDVIDTVASRILEAVSEPLRLERATELTPSVSLGVAISSRDATGETLLRDADAALYRSKAAGRGRVAHFDADLRTAVLDRLMIESDLRPALANGDISCVFQPEIVLATGELFGFEALSRWNHHESGAIAPLRFVPVAESTGVAPALFANALECALVAQAQWNDVLGPATNIAVNLSPMQLHDPTLVPAVAELLARFGAPADSLWLEVTEEALADLPGLSTLEALRDLGVHMAIDDFGIGWSSMARLGAFPWDIIKIDRSFVAELGTSPQADHIVQAMVYMAHALGMRTVAEGVERPDQLRRLREIGCDIVQGYAIARPLSPDDVPAWDAAQRLHWRAPA